LVAEQTDIEKILSSKTRLKTLIKNELIEIKDEFGEERKSPIKEATEAKVFSEEETLVTEPITVVLSAAGWIRSAKGHEIDPSSLSYRGEDVLQDYGRGKSNQVSVFLDSNGKAYSLASHSLPSARGMGDPITGRVSADSGVKFISSLIGNDEDKFMIMNTAGYGYISEFKNMVSNKKSGKAFMKIPHEADLLKAIKVRDDHLYIAAVSNIGRLLIFKIDELPILGKGKGNKIINIPTAKFIAKEELMTHAQLVSEASSLRIESGKRFLNLKLKDLENYISTRAKRGNMLPQGYRKVDKMIEEVELEVKED
jgi:topoisomerase-4 subunit A